MEGQRGVRLNSLDGDLEGDEFLLEDHVQRGGYGKGRQEGQRVSLEMDEERRVAG